MAGFPFRSVAFSGTRAAPVGLAKVARLLAVQFLAAGARLLVGCAQGIDAAVVDAATALLSNGGAPGRLCVLAVASGPRPGSLGSGAIPAGLSFRWSAGGCQFPLRAALVQRSAALVAALVSGPGSAALLALPHKACPRRLRPSAQARACFSGFASGTWSTAALAAGLGASVFVHGPAGWLPQSWPGSWVPSSLFPGFSRFVPAATQPRLF